MAKKRFDIIVFSNTTVDMMNGIAGGKCRKRSNMTPGNIMEFLNNNMFDRVIIKPRSVET